MILDTLDFTDFFKYIEGIFSNHFSVGETKDIMEFVDILSDANFRCYRANMIVIKERKKDKVDNDLISEMEWVARSVGEYRVSSKARINRFIANVRPKQVINQTLSWSDDDVVYSVGEMMDRLSIETIKREDFLKNNRAKHMTESSQDLSDRVTSYLRYKLEAIATQGYECAHEQRTYDLEKIVKELVI